MTLLPVALLMLAQSGGITGQAIDARTGNPVRRAVIVATTEDLRVHHTEAGPDGRFVFENLPPGDYLLRGERFGYTRWFGSAGRGSTRVLIRPGVQILPVVVKLTPQAAAEGILTDEAGDPVQGARVELKKLGGRQPIIEAFTNDRGEYRLYGLAAGSYRLMASAPGKPLALYPQLVQLRAGDDLRAINFSVNRVRLCRVRGRVSEPATINLIPKSARDTDSHSVQATAAFDINSVLPGEYWLRAVSERGDRFALLELDVNDEIGNVTVTLEPGALVRGTINSQDRFTLRGLHAGQEYDAIPNAKGAFEILSVAPDLYAVRVTPSALDAYVESIRYNNETAPLEGIAITGGRGELQVTLGTKGAEFIVVALDDNYQEVPGAHIVLWLVDPGRQAPYWLDQFTVNNGGQAAVRGIAPGEYFAVALDDWEAMDHADWDPARLAALEPLAERVKFGPGERVVRYLRVANPAP
jgi:hypothetical protein